MFIRYSIGSAAEEIANRFAVEVPGGYQPRYNAAPTHLLPLITNDSQKGISFFYWGAPPSMANQKLLGERLINVKAEAIGEKQVILKKMRERRCIIPADGFFAWKKTGKKSSIPYRFTLPDKAIFAMAGLWEEYEDEHDEMHHTFSIITTEANASVKMVDERMPLILAREKEKLWLGGLNDDQLVACLQFFKGRLEYYPVSNRVNFPERNERQIILPAPAADQFGNLSLFD